MSADIILLDMDVMCTTDKICFLQHLPNFGMYKQRKDEIIAKHKETDDLLGEQYQPELHQPVRTPKMTIPVIKVLQL